MLLPTNNYRKMGNPGGNSKLRLLMRLLGVVLCILSVYFLYNKCFEDDVKYRRRKFIVVLGGGVAPGGGLPTWVEKRACKAEKLFNEANKLPTIVTLSRGTPHKPNPLDKVRSPNANPLHTNPRTNPMHSQHIMTSSHHHPIHILLLHWHHHHHTVIHCSTNHTPLLHSLRKPLLTIKLHNTVLHTTALRDKDGYPIYESTATAKYLLEMGVPAEKIIEESYSLDTVGNVRIRWQTTHTLSYTHLTASHPLPLTHSLCPPSHTPSRTLSTLPIPPFTQAYFLRTMHLEPSSIRKLVIVTNKWHMPRTKAIFGTSFTFHAPYQHTLLTQPI